MNQGAFKDATYYDEDGMEIQENDLLQVFHFIHYRNRRKVYMYHVAVIEDGYWKGKEYHKNEGHYWLKSVADKQTGIIKGAKIVYKPDWENEDRLRQEAKSRIGLPNDKPSVASKAQ